MYQCPNDCGSTTFLQVVEQDETVHADGNGDPLFVEPRGHVETHHVECADCGAEVTG